MTSHTKPFILGITGGSASGKTLFLKKLLNTFTSDQVCLISQDNYYKSRAEQPIDENGVHNFDMPASLDFAQYAEDIIALRSGGIVEREEYTFNNPNAVPKKLIWKSAPIIIVEGLFVFYIPEIARLIDLKVFIDAKEAIKLKRRILRDNLERGYDLDDVLYRYENHVAPTYDKYIAPFKHEADLVIPNNTDFQKGLDVLVAFMHSKLAK